MVVVMLFGSLELALETMLTGSEIGCGLWVGVGAALCGGGLDELVDIGIAAGVVVGNGRCIEVGKWVVVELTSGIGGVIELLEGAMELEGVEDELGSSEIRYIVYSPNIPARQGTQN